MGGMKADRKMKYCNYQYLILLFIVIVFKARI
jgi:hypothetical protein